MIHPIQALIGISNVYSIPCLAVTLFSTESIYKPHDNFMILVSYHYSSITHWFFTTLILFSLLFRPLLFSLIIQYISSDVAQYKHFGLNSDWTFHFDMYQTIKCFQYYVDLKKNRNQIFLICLNLLHPLSCKCLGISSL